MARKRSFACLALLAVLLLPRLAAAQPAVDDPPSDEPPLAQEPDSPPGEQTETLPDPFSGETALFITPGYRFRTVDAMLTNFHLPRSTLYMLVCAFCGLDVMRRAYEHAIARDYRFYSYGDACLLFR